jgi:hypothetical protein
LNFLSNPFFSFSVFYPLSLFFYFDFHKREVSFFFTLLLYANILVISFQSIAETLHSLLLLEVGKKKHETCSYFMFYYMHIVFECEFMAWKL